MEEQGESRVSGPDAPGKSLVVMGILSISSTDKINCENPSFHIYQYEKANPCTCQNYPRNTTLSI